MTPQVLYRPIRSPKRERPKKRALPERDKRIRLDVIEILIEARRRHQ